MVAPLTPAVLHILIVLADSEAHGYAIMKRVEADSEGRVKMGPGTLYGSLKRMIDAGLVRETAAPSGSEDPRRIYYAITGAGSAALDAELDRYRAVVSRMAARPAHP
jgi:DNA-binding PadR family transcriptional regulator